MFLFCDFRPVNFYPCKKNEGTHAISNSIVRLCVSLIGVFPMLFKQNYNMHAEPNRIGHPRSCSRNPSAVEVCPLNINLLLMNGLVDGLIVACIKTSV